MNKGYSVYLRPFMVILDLIILNLFFYILIVDRGYIYDPEMNIRFYVGLNIGWLLISYIIGLYRVYRFTRIVKIVGATINQLIIFSLLLSSLFSWSYVLLHKQGVALYIVVFGIVIFLIRFFMFYGLKNYRVSGHNFRSIIIVGHNNNSVRLHNLIENKPEYGYKFLGFFSDNPKHSKSIKGKLDDIKKYVLDNGVNEIYCTLGEIDYNTIKDLINFSENNMVVIKFIPEEKGIFDGRALKLQYYDFQPIITLRENPFEDSIPRYSKRLFDILFSSFIIMFVLSWLVPILGIFIKLESKGPILFKQKRNGLGGSEFGIYKFRSMGVNIDSDKKQAVANDPRVTKIGAFIRSTSIDELPQFINVFLGEMSVVGPRPHMVSHTDYYSKIIDKYLVRQMVKPGITGLAQIRGFRGETETVNQMSSRARIDRFYIENWSMLLDAKIILKTLTNSIGKDDKAY